MTNLLKWKSQRLDAGITNLRAVCVGLKLATLMSVSPDFSPVERTSDSVIVFWPLG